MTHKEQVAILYKEAKEKFSTAAELNAYFEGRKDQLAEDRKILTGRSEEKDDIMLQEAADQKSERVLDDEANGEEVVKTYY